MSLYTVGGKGLNEYESDAQPDVLYPAPDPQPTPPPQPDPIAATNAALQVIADPTSLITEAAPSLPWPVAVIGACVVAMIWANYLDGGRGK